MTDAEFEAMMFSTEDEAFSAGIEQYGFIELVSGRNPDGSWYVYPKDEE